MSEHIMRYHYVYSELSIAQQSSVENAGVDSIGKNGVQVKATAEEQPSNQQNTPCLLQGCAHQGQDCLDLSTPNALHVLCHVYKSASVCIRLKLQRQSMPWQFLSITLAVLALKPHT